jgi:hypothetical protein
LTDALYCPDFVHKGQVFQRINKFFGTGSGELAVGLNGKGLAFTVNVEVDSAVS